MILTLKRKEVTTVENQMKIVNFDKYCSSCMYSEVKETDDPCNECLTSGANLYSDRPIKYREKKGSRKNGG